MLQLKWTDDDVSPLNRMHEELISLENRNRASVFKIQNAINWTREKKSQALIKTKGISETS